MKHSKFALLFLLTLVIIGAAIGISTGGFENTDQQAQFFSIFGNDTNKNAGDTSSGVTPFSDLFGGNNKNESQTIATNKSGLGEPDIIGFTRIESSGADNCIWLFSYCPKNGGTFTKGEHDVTCSCDGLSSGIVTKDEISNAISDAGAGKDTNTMFVSGPKQIDTSTIVGLIASGGNLSRGVRNQSAVRELQQTLTDLEFYNARINGLFGRRTKLSVEDFQTTYGLMADGIAGPQTLTRLMQVSGGIAPTFTSFVSGKYGRLGDVTDEPLKGEMIVRYMGGGRCIAFFYDDDGNFTGSRGGRTRFGGDGKQSCELSVKFSGGLLNASILADDSESQIDISDIQISANNPATAAFIEDIKFIFGSFELAPK
ncbi:MAG: peptidoglycan-binding protein, partial [Candidatus Nomurabacteria bacterium]|nr:peptidoglycan-binding protein [Candidatus Nomurabacteria bacterium]